MQTCSSNGLNWNNTTDCGIAGCNPTTKACNNKLCNPDEKRCFGTMLQTCSSDGLKWNDTIDCGSAGCDPTTKACKVDDRECSTGQKRCSADGKTAEFCSTEGRWTTVDCGTAGCNDGSCNVIPSDNTDNTSSCNDSSVNTAVGCVPMEVKSFAVWFLNRAFGIGGGLPF